MMLEKALRWTALAGIFILPFLVLFVSRSLFFPFITGKNFAFRVLVEIIGVAWLALALINPAYRPKRSWVLYAFAAFVVAIGIADALGVYPFKSFWSNYERMEGWVTLAHLFVYFTAAISLLSVDLWRKWWQTSLGVSALVGGFGLLQLAGLATINQGGVRLDATLGNATYLAVYMLFHIFVAALFFAETWTKYSPNKRMTPALVYGSVIALDTLILFFTATRGALLGLIGGVVLTAILLIVAQPRTKMASRAGVVLSVVVLLIGGIWLMRNTSFVQSNGSLARLSSISLTDITTQPRFMNWGMAWEGFKERPIFGWGQENYAIVFDKYYDPGMYGQEPWFDRVHQLFLDWLIAGGIVGLLAYLSIHAATLWTLWRSNAFSILERSIVTGLLAGYVFYLLFTFDNIISYLLFVSLLAFIVVRASGDAPIPATRALVPRAAYPLVALSVLLIAGGLVWSVNGEAYLANRAIIQGLSPQPEGLSKNLEYFERSIAYGTFGTQEAREHLSQTAAQLAAPEVNATPDVKKAFLETASSEMVLQMQAAPLSARFPFFLGILHDSFGDHGNGRVALEKAHELSPRKQSILFQLAMNAFARNDTAESIRVLKLAYDIDPENREAAALYAAVMISSGDIAGADEIVGNMASAGYSIDQRVLSAYVSQNRFDKVAQFMGAYVKARPDDVPARITQAAALYASGDSNGSIQVLQEVQRVSPQSAAAAASLILQVQAGTWNVR